MHRKKNILLVEDNLSFALDIEMMLESTSYALEKVTNSEQALALLDKRKFDLLLIDVYIDGRLTGIELADLIKPKNTPIIFFTAHNDLLLYEQAQLVGFFAYLIKPFDQLTLRSAIEKALEADIQTINLVSSIGNLKHVGMNKQQEHFFIRLNNHFYKIIIKDIKWIHSEGNYSTLHTSDKRLPVKMSLVKLLEYLKKHSFLQIHNRYLVNMNPIESIDIVGSKLLIGGEKLPIGRSYKSNFLKQINLLQ